MCHMKKMNFLLVLLMFPAIAFGAGRADGTARIGVNRGGQSNSRMSITSLDVKDALAKGSVTTKVEEVEEEEEEPVKKTTKTVAKSEPEEEVVSTKTASTPKGSGDCRETYRDCMDQFCLLDESQGERCACSDNIELAKSKIKAVLEIQAEADKLFTEGVEREQLGAKAALVFNDKKGNKGVSGTSFLAWLGGAEADEEDEDGDVGEDVTMGDDLYQMAVKYCSAELESCGTKGEMESMLYTRMIAQDCKNYDAYLKDQKANAESNKRIAESAVRKARLEMLDTTNKYNRGECLLAFRACVADKGGCGTNFENCLDKKLLERRSNACENVLDQCMAVRDYVKQDWAQETKSILADAEKYADKHRRGTCLAKAQFCENDIDKCLRDKCGQDFTKPECVGKKPYEIAALCPQDMFPSCDGAAQYDIIVQSAILQMDYQMLQGCVNYFSDQLSKVCGTDMACLPIDATVEALTDLPDTEEGLFNLRKQVVANSDAAVEEFFVQFEQDKTVTACADSQSVADDKKKLKGKNSLGSSVFNTAKLLAKMSAENRNLRELDSKIAELARKKDLEEAKEICLKTYKPEKPPKEGDDGKKASNYSYIRTVSFEPSLRNCHVCRMQQVCEEGGEDKATSALKAAAGGLSAGASAGTMVSAGWGTAIGGLVGGVGAGVMGYMSGGKKEFCQELESCEDINM